MERYKVAGLCIRDRKLLVVRNNGEQVFFALGGQREDGETDLECLARECLEEVGCKPKNPVHYRTFEGTGHHGKPLVMACYFTELDGIIVPQSEVEACTWVDRDYLQQGVSVSCILGRQIIPALINDKYL